MKVEGYEDFRETKRHGDVSFPFNIYPCAIPDMFPEVMTHWHEEMEIILVKKGGCIVSVDFKDCELTAPAIVFIFPGQMHSIRQRAGQRVAYENIIFHPKLLYSGKDALFDREYLRPLFEGHILVPTALDDRMPFFETLLSPLQACTQMMKERDKAYPLYIKSQLYLLCYELLRDYPLCEPAIREKSFAHKVKPVLLLIEQHFAEQIRVADAARHMGFSEAYFMYVFKEIMGVSFVTYLKDYRLSKAEQCLRSSDDSVLAIAQSCGFQNFSYFIRSFKSRYGVTPLKYREMRSR